MNKPQDGTESIESLRQLAAGTAHDVNNLLLLVSGCAELALMDDTLSPGTRQLMSEILDAGERATTLTQRLLSVSRPPAARAVVVDVGALLTSSATLFGRLVGDGIRLDLDVSAAPLWVLADASQLEQVIVNLVLNARDAMSPGGTLAITAGAADAAAERHRASGRVARVTVTDTGSGIDPAILERMYEPYVTSKSSDKHSGLGLAVVRGVVEQLGGAIGVTTAPGTGTTFTIDLPLARLPGAPT